MSLSTLEAQIKNDWNWVRANIALHPYLAVGATAILFFLLGKLPLPFPL